MRLYVKTLALAALLLPEILVGCTVRATVQAPPPDRVEVIPPSPGGRQVWIPGHYVRRGRNYIWVNGFYRAAPARYTAWVPGHWQQSPRGSVWVEGHWR